MFQKPIISILDEGATLYRSTIYIQSTWILRCLPKETKMRRIYKITLLDLASALLSGRITDETRSAMRVLSRVFISKTSAMPLGVRFSEQLGSSAIACRLVLGIPLVHAQMGSCSFTELQVRRPMAYLRYSLARYIERRISKRPIAAAESNNIAHKL